MAADRNLDVVLALAAAAWKAGVPADEIIRVVQTIELEPRESGEKDAPAEPVKTDAGGYTIFDPETAVPDGMSARTVSGIGGTDLKPAKPE